METRSSPWTDAMSAAHLRIEARSRRPWTRGACLSEASAIGGSSTIGTAYYQGPLRWHRFARTVVLTSCWVVSTREGCEQRDSEPVEMVETDALTLFLRGVGSIALLRPAEEIALAR